ncbi:hypothetical protein J2T55_000364 [Methylohalomonas lacus]|uniref:Beta-ketoacyl synthase-like N-terminal domain-containing protein n=1 Tax=Methylohalomonas lacus TaxID=398773 RepID=A0AAE3HKZ6_9GAMM|nr:beta-ketoacyl synthase chain length factor [Methylohalomonas lacus]MCS3902368.1 hypothetical protein [Methylohalomonas lacus]
MPSVELTLVDWYVWTDDPASNALHGEQLPAAELGKQLDAGMRRRQGLFGRATAQVIATAGADGASPSLVLASRHGDLQRTLKMIADIAAGESPSPTDFSMSVHNAPLGIAAIQWAINTPHSALAAGRDTLLAGLTEAVAQLQVQPDQPVLLVYTDLPLPDAYADNDPPDTCSCALALLLAAPGGPGVRLEFSAHADQSADVWPLRQALALARWLDEVNNDEDCLLLSGEHGGWQLRRVTTDA